MSLGGLKAGPSKMPQLPSWIFMLPNIFYAYCAEKERGWLAFRIKKIKRYHVIRRGGTLAWVDPWLCLNAFKGKKRITLIPTLPGLLTKKSEAGSSHTLLVTPCRIQKKNISRQLKDCKSTSITMKQDCYNFSFSWLRENLFSCYYKTQARYLEEFIWFIHSSRATTLHSLHRPSALVFN